MTFRVGKGEAIPGLDVGVVGMLKGAHRSVRLAWFHEGEGGGEKPLKDLEWHDVLFGNGFLLEGTHPLF